MTSQERLQHILENEPKLIENFNKIEYGFAVLQLKDVDSELPDAVHFRGYDEVTEFIGRELKFSDYHILAVEEIPMEKRADILYGAASGAASVANYVFDKYNGPERPLMSEGYYGTSVSVSDVILVKKENVIEALYVEYIGFKFLDDFLPQNK